MNDITIEEAIERIQSIKSKVSLYDDVLALRMAEEALEKQADIISRIEAEKNKLNVEGELFYSKSEIAIFDKCLEIIKEEE